MDRIVLMGATLTERMEELAFGLSRPYVSFGAQGLEGAEGMTGPTGPAGAAGATGTIPIGSGYVKTYSRGTVYTNTGSAVYLVYISIGMGTDPNCTAQIVLNTSTVVAEVATPLSAGLAIQINAAIAPGTSYALTAPAGGSITVKTWYEYRLGG